MADAVANLDGLRLLAPVPRRPAFPERLTTYLEAEFPFVEPRAKLTGASGSPYQVTAVGSSEKQPVYVHTAAGQNTTARRSAVERCFTMFSDVNGHLPAERKHQSAGRRGLRGYLDRSQPVDRVRLGQPPRVATECSPQSGVDRALWSNIHP